MQSLQAATDDSKRCQAKKHMHTPNLHVLFAPCSNSCCSCCHTPHLSQLRRKIMPCTRILLPNSPEQSAKSQVYVHHCAAACSRACTPASNPSCSHTIAAQYQSWLQADNMIYSIHTMYSAVFTAFAPCPLHSGPTGHSAHAGSSRLQLASQWHWQQRLAACPFLQGAAQCPAS